MLNIHYFEISSLSFDIRKKIGVCTLSKPHAIFQSLLLEMLGFVHSFMTGELFPNYQGVLTLYRFKRPMGFTCTMSNEV